MQVKRRFSHVAPATQMASKGSPKTSLFATAGPPNRPKRAKWALLKTRQKNTFKKTPQSAKTTENEPNSGPNPNHFWHFFLPPKPYGSQTGPGPQKTPKSVPETCFFRPFSDDFRCLVHPDSTYFACPWWPQRATVSCGLSYDNPCKR